MVRKLSKSLRKKAQKLGVRVTVKRNGKRVYKSPKLLKQQCKRKSRRKKKSKRRKKFKASDYPICDICHREHSPAAACPRGVSPSTAQNLVLGDQNLRRHIAGFVGADPDPRLRPGPPPDDEDIIPVPPMLRRGGRRPNPGRRRRYRERWEPLLTAQNRYRYDIDQWEKAHDRYIRSGIYNRKARLAALGRLRSRSKKTQSTADIKKGRLKWLIN